MHTRVNSITSASAFTIAVFGSSVAAAQENAASFEFQGDASAELLEVLKMPHADALYDDFGIAVIPANDLAGAGIGSVLFPIKSNFDLINLNAANLGLPDRYVQLATSFGQAKSLDGR